MMWALSEAAEQAGGYLTGVDAPFDRVVTDSRSDCTGALFVALRGERFDAHAFVPQAMANGAVAALVERPLDLDLPQWVVDDTRLGLGRLAAAWRRRIPARVLAITGSNGKTTCKEMVAAILAQVGSVRATQGNLNNDIGMPLTLLRARDEAWLVLELGANHHGEIGYLTEIARPEAALIANAGRAHLEGFGSVEGVARAKGEIARGLPADGTFVVPGDAPWTALWRDLAQGRRLLTFGLDPACAVHADPAQVTGDWTEDGFCDPLQRRPRRDPLRAVPGPGRSAQRAQRPGRCRPDECRRRLVPGDCRRAGQPAPGAGAFGAQASSGICA